MIWFAALTLTIVTVWVYWPVTQFDFVAFDDGVYVQSNPRIVSGISWDGVVWAFGGNHAHMWHPLTTLSHMLDCHLFGLDAGAHHSVNLLLHTTSTLLLFALMLRFTGRLPESFVIAALFAWHPLRVESVAWVAERKDVLCTLFWMLTLHAYAGYVRNRTTRNYAILIVTYALGILTKPMIVTLPFALLLLDIWPLMRIDVGTPNAGVPRYRAVLSQFAPLIREKLPIFALSILLSAVTYMAQKGGAIMSTEQLGYGDRVAHAAISYVQYLGKLMWPVDLAVFYPHPGTWPMPQVFGAATILVIFSVVAIRHVHSHPYLFVGWSWYLGTLVPVIGLVQVGEQAIADRYTYVPTLGLFIAMVWCVFEAISSRRVHKRIGASLAIVALANLLFATSTQVQHWRNTETLFAHAVQVTRNNPKAHFILGAAYLDAGRLAEALDQYQTALQLEPRNPNAYFQLARCLTALGRAPQAARFYREALRLRPQFPEAHVNLGGLLLSSNQPVEAMEHFRAALAADPMNAEACNNLGLAHLMQNQFREAATNCLRAISLKPDYAQAHANLGAALLRLEQVQEASHHLNQAVRLNAGLAEAHYNLAAALLKLGQPEAAMRHYTEAKKLNPALGSAPAQR
ncbi:MAG: tetratricopeptide repeat protein [Verrucomicrobiota bacterium]